jgi:lysophospholipase L1-like esterase
MRSLVFLVSLLVLVTESHAQFNSNNQRPYDTIPNLPEHYANKVAQFQQEPIVKGRVIFLGNSITEGGNWKQLLGDTTIINRGIGGDNTFGVLKRLDDITRRKPSKLFILIGINDLSKDIPPAVIAANYQQIIRRVKQESPATRTYVQSILPLNTTVQNFPPRYHKQAAVHETNRLIRTLAASEKVTYINLVPLLSDAQQRLKAEYTGDGLHLKTAGYRQWADYLKKQGYF